MTNNRKLGNSFEAEFANMLFARGYWVHLLTQNKAGQPADLIAMKDDCAMLIDCKVCSGNGFPISRVEQNQWTAMQLLDERTEFTPYFALKLRDASVWMVSYGTMLRCKKLDIPSLPEAEIRKYGSTFEEWVTLEWYR